MKTNKKITLVFVLACISITSLYSQDDASKKAAAAEKQSSIYGADQWLSGIKALSVFTMSSFRDVGVGLDINGFLLAIDTKIDPLEISLGLGFDGATPIIGNVLFFEFGAMYCVPLYSADDDSNITGNEAEITFTKGIKTSIGLKAKIYWAYIAVGVDLAGVIMNSTMERDQKKIPVIVKVGYNIR